MKLSRNKLFILGMLIFCAICVFITAGVPWLQSILWGAEDPIFTQPTSYYDVIEKMADKYHIDSDTRITSIYMGNAVTVCCIFPEDNESSIRTVYSWDSDTGTVSTSYRQTSEEYAVACEECFMTMEELLKYFEIMEEINVANLLEYESGESIGISIQETTFAFEDNAIEDVVASYQDATYFVLEDTVVSKENLTENQFEYLQNQNIVKIFILLGDYGSEEYRVANIFIPAQS
ncbi:MAG: hypothetical protein R3Y65_05645 [Bacillota bacterium]